MSNLAVNAITDASGGTTASINGHTPSASNMTGRNRIINGAMMIDQRNAGASVTQTTSLQYPVDRFAIVGTQASKFTAQQSSTVPSGFGNSIICTSSSAYSLGATDHFSIRHYVEGLNVADLGWGTASAKTITLSFWVRSSLTGTFGGSISNSAQDRFYPFSYTINSANTWEQKTITIAGDTTGTWLTTNGIGVRLLWSLGVGTTYSGTAGSWGSTLYFSVTGATSVVGTSGATFYLTGVQLEVGSSASEFEHRQYGQELALCQRYFCTSTLNPATDTWYLDNGGFLCVDMEDLAMGGVRWPVEMRATPTVVGYAAGVTNAIKSWGANATRNITGYRISRWGWNATSHDGGYNLGRPYTCTWTASAEL